MAKLTKEAVELAVAEYDALGGKAFRAKYGFKGARDYFLTHNGKDYDSKAIAAVAHKFLTDGDGVALTHDQLSGGVSDAAGKLMELGFEVATRSQNEDWSWDEHVLALELYLANPISIPGKTSKAVGDLSKLLIRLGERRGVSRTRKFRNTNGVYMKLMNLKRSDPAVKAAGRSGLKRGNKLEQRVWDEFASDPEKLRIAANAIRLAIEDEAVTLATADDDSEAEEGSVILRLHKSRERSRKLVADKKRNVLKSAGTLTCEVCEFSFGERYGSHGEDFIEVIIRNRSRPL